LLILNLRQNVCIIHVVLFTGPRSETQLSEEDQNKLLSEYEEEIKNSDELQEQGNLSRRSSGTQLSSSSSGSFAIVTHDSVTDEVKVE